MSPRPLPGFRIAIRCNAVLSNLVQLWSSKGTADDPHVPGTEFDLTGYSQLFSTAKQNIADTAPLVTITAVISDIGLDSSGNQISVDTTKGWVQLYAPVSETANAQSIAELSTSASVRGFVDLLGFDSQGNLEPVAWGYADFLPGVTE